MKEIKGGKEGKITGRKEGEREGRVERNREGKKYIKGSKTGSLRGNDDEIKEMEEGKEGKIKERIE